VSRVLHSRSRVGTSFPGQYKSPQGRNKLWTSSVSNRFRLSIMLMEMHFGDSCLYIFESLFRACHHNSPCTILGHISLAINFFDASHLFGSIKLLSLFSSMFLHNVSIQCRRRLALLSPGVRNTIGGLLEQKMHAELAFIALYHHLELTLYI